MPGKSQYHLSEIQRTAAGLKGEDKKLYARGVHDGLQLAQLLYDEKKVVSLATDPVLSAFMRYLEEQS